MYDRLAEAGYESDGTQALIKLWWQDGKNLKMIKINCKKSMQDRI